MKKYTHKCCGEVFTNVDDARRHIHWHRLGTKATEDDCRGCQKLAEKYLNESDGETSVS